MLENAYVIDWICRNCKRKGAAVVLVNDPKTPGQRAYIAHQSRAGRERCVRPSITWKRRDDGN